MSSEKYGSFDIEWWKSNFQEIKLNECKEEEEKKRNTEI